MFRIEENTIWLAILTGFEECLCKWKAETHNIIPFGSKLHHIFQIYNVYITLVPNKIQSILYSACIDTQWLHKCFSVSVFFFSFAAIFIYLNFYQAEMQCIKPLSLWKHKCTIIRDPACSKKHGISPTVMRAHICSQSKNVTQA